MCVGPCLCVFRICVGYFPVALVGLLAFARFLDPLEVELDCGFFVFLRNSDDEVVNKYKSSLWRFVPFACVLFVHSYALSW